MDTIARHASPEHAAMAHSAAPSGLLDGFARRELAKGYLLSTPASPHNQVLMVHSGRLRVYLAGDNRELNLSFLEPGDIYTTHTPTYVEAVVASSIWLIDTRTFAQKLATDPSVTPVMMRVMGRLLSNAVGLIEDLAFREVPARLARFLCQLAERRGLRQEHGWLVPLEFSMQDIASLLGTTRQTVSSLINQWERDGILLRQSRRSLLLPSLESLKARCSPIP
ncbi:MAG: transcriptional regulator, Crp/Fnr family [Proteobacteria bacterium]|nr:transcriptional regulator, Crp/Fnr family [Pseudomonadota bacterium]